MSVRATQDSLAVRVAELAARLTGRAVVGVDELEPGLGTRRFLRVRLAGGAPASLIARVEDPEAPKPGAPIPEPPLEPIRALLEQRGLPVPAQLGADEAAGIALIEDVGDTSLERAVADVDVAQRRALYAEAVALVPRIQAVEPVDASRVGAFGRALDRELIASKARKWLEWTIPFARGRPATDEERRATQRAFAVATAACADAPARLAHRDFKAANLHLVPDPHSVTGHRLVMIDLQGAFMAPPEYDLACLLRDAHVALSEDEVGEHLGRVRDQLPDAPTPADFERRFDLLTLVRVAKDISHYVDAAATRGDDRYLRFVATGMRNLRRAAHRATERDAEVAPFAALVDAMPEDFAVQRPAKSRGGPACAP